MHRPHEVRIGTIVVAATLVVAIGLAPFTGDFTLFVLSLVVIQAIAVLSLNMLMGYAGQVSLGQAAFVGVGAFGAAEAAHAGAPFPLPILAGVVGGAIVATIVGLPSLRIRGFQVAATTLAFGLVAERMLFARPWDTEAGTGLAVTRPSALDASGAFLAVAVAGLLIVIGLDRAIRTSRVGRAFFAVRDREDTAASRGVDLGPTKLLAYAVSGGVAGLAGGLFAYLLERATAESFTVFVSLGMIAAVVVGGLGSWSGAIVASVAFTGLPELLRPVAGYAPLAGAALLLIVPLVRPAGLGWWLERRVRLAPHAGASSPPAALEPVRRSIPLSIPVRTVMQVLDVGVSFGGVRALDHVSFDVRRGEILGLIGPNGAGKSTLFDVLSGRTQPTAGTVTYRGRDLLRLPAHARSRVGIARTFQQVGLSPTLSVRDNLLVALHDHATYGVVPALTRWPTVRAVEAGLAERAAAALAVVGLTHVADRTTGSLPHGSQRLTEVAAALATSPDLLLLDEPFAGTGPEESEQLAATLLDLRDRLGITMIVIEHDVPLVARLSDHIVVLDRGRVLAQGPPRAIQRNPDVAAVYIGTPTHDGQVAHA